MSIKDYQTLHSHTTTSDGKLTHLELLKAAEENGISVVAFTDHDSLPNSKTLDQLKLYENQLTKWIVGIEISAGMPEEMGGGSAGGPHVVGLFVDPTHKPLLEHCQKAQAARIERMQRLVKNLQGLGFQITADDCLSASGGESVGRPHIVEALKSKPENLHVIQKLRQQMAMDAKQDNQLKLKYDQMMESGERQYPYALFLSSEAYLSHIYVSYLYRLSLDQSVNLIRQAGGVAVIAHYFSIASKISLEVVENLLKSNRLDGMETVYGIELYNGSRRGEIDQQRNQIRELVIKYQKVVSGGADAHEEQDLVDFAQASWYAEETIGMAEKIIQLTKVKTEWSSVKS